MIYNFIAYFIVALAIGYAAYKGYKFFSNWKKGTYCGSCKSCVNYDYLKKLI